MAETGTAPINFKTTKNVSIPEDINAKKRMILSTFPNFLNASETIDITNTEMKNIIPATMNRRRK